MTCSFSPVRPRTGSCSAATRRDPVDHRLVRIQRGRSPPRRARRSRRTALGDGEPHADSFALDEVGCILLSALRDWTRDSPTTAVLGIARSIIRFVENVIPDPDDHGDTRATLETMRDEHLEWARAVQSMTARP
ncbi:hypothetical protein ACLF6K_00270 [Streptomyces xanthophaeus]|uniref:hypothetical protein n=1 Tax=Streptomyces xanthophaeus TaxID=67385 RepID=UPI00398F9CCB